MLRSVLIAVMVFCSAAIGCKQAASIPTESPSGPTPTASKDTAAAPTAASRSPWDVSQDTNAVTGEVTKVASTGYGDEHLIVRRRGKKTDCYVTTGDFLETVDNLDSRTMAVRFKFDDGKVLRQIWTISDDNTALFCPGDGRAFLAQLSKAKTFAFEYKPADKLPKSLSFDVSDFPSDLATRQ